MYIPSHHNRRLEDKQLNEAEIQQELHSTGMWESITINNGILVWSSTFVISKKGLTSHR